MNIRISENALRFRLEPHHAQQLLLEGTLSMSMRSLRYLKECQILLLDTIDELALVQMRDGLILNVQRDAFSRFVDELPRKTGLEKTVTINGTPITLSLEVNCKIRRRERSSER